jgi:hypothetical protein
MLETVDFKAQLDKKEWTCCVGVSVPGDQQEGGVHTERGDQGGQALRVRGGGVHPQQAVYGKENILRRF